MADCLVSLIIPVYNSEMYLKKCLESAVNQTLKEIEIIIVDDGSNDKSASIIREFAFKDTRIKTFSQENKGPGAARNLGLLSASGEYIFDYLRVQGCK